MTVHHRLGPSRSKRYILCPGSLAREEALPKEQQDQESPAAREGTRAHQLLEHCILNLVRPADVKGSLTDDVGEWTPDAEMINHIQEVIDYIGHRQLELMSSKVFTEKQVDPEVLTGCAEQGGTLDIQLFSLYKKTLEIADLKYGKGLRVDPENNTQLVLYSLGALADLMEPAGDWDSLAGKVETVVCTIMQPRYLVNNKIARSVTYTIPELKVYAQELGEAGKLALSGLGPIIPGNEQCQWCAAGPGCEERAQWAMESSGLVFGDVSEKSAEELRGELLEAVDVDPNGLSDDKLASILDGLPAIEAYIRNMKTEARRRMERGRAVPGYKLVYGRRSRAWAASETDVKKRLKSMKIRVADFEQHKLLGVAKIRGIIPESKQAKFDELWEWREGNLAVAQDTDERPAVDTTALQFSPIKESEDE